MSRKFRVAARAPSTALVRPGESITVNYILDERPIMLTFRTRYHEQGFSTQVPGDLWLDAVGEAEDIRAAMSICANAGRDIAAIIAICANAAVAPLEPEIAYDATAGLTKREYFQRFMRAEGMAYSSRFVDVEATVAVAAAIATHGERNRLIRAISQYSEALGCWRMGYELLSVSHLFMGVEAIKRAAWRHLCSTSGKPTEELAEAWGYKKSGRLPIKAFLDSEARVRLVFQGDQQTHGAAKNTSDHFEHGFSNAGSLYESARNCQVLTARYLREAILSMLDIERSHSETLLGPKFNSPRGATRLERYLWGSLMGEGEQLAAPDQEYPICQWKFTIKDVTFDPATNEYSFKPENTCTVSCAEGIGLTDIKLEMWDGSVFTPPIKGGVDT